VFLFDIFLGLGTKVQNGFEIMKHGIYQLYSIFTVKVGGYWHQSMLQCFLIHHWMEVISWPYDTITMSHD